MFKNMDLRKKLILGFGAIISLVIIGTIVSIIEEGHVASGHYVEFSAVVVAFFLAFFITKSASEENIKSLRLNLALEKVNGNVMMADEGNNIIYMNHAVLKMMQNAEADIRTDLPNFDSSKLIGQNIDVFHKNPAHQRGMLEKLDDSYEATINVGGRIFDLIANPVFGGGNKRIGTVVEWQDVTELRATEERAARIQTSLDCVSSNVMMADENNDIIYMNPAVLKMMQNAESDIRTDLPNFDSSKLIGSNIDVFHKNPAHQQAMLKSLTSTYDATINVGGRIFDLRANPVNSPDDRRIGTVVEWNDVTELRALEAKQVRIQTSLDSVTSNVMLADENNDIIYMNGAVRATMKAAEADIRKDLPNFDVDKIVGSNVDIFHKNPDHQQKMLKALTSTYETSIKIGVRTFELVANPVLGNDGERLGTVVEWKDTTAELAIEDEINKVVEASVQGDFSQRLSVEGKDGFMLNLSEGINKIGEISLTGLTEVVEVIDSLSQGQLTKKIEGDYDGIFERIKSSLNSTIAKLSDMVSQIQVSAQTVNSASQEISSGSADLSHRTEQQASTLEETAASMEELTGTVRQNGDNANKASSVAGDANNVATKGGEVVSDAVGAMVKIEDSSKKISDIIGVIDEIAFQTNLLALNAAVEAARAGEAGKGFAVVASEVRTLAGRSASASKDIKALISESVEQVSSGSELVNEAGETLKEIVESVKQVAGLITEIADASSEQTTAIEEINTAVAQMDEGTQQNAALVEENTAAAQSLVEQSEDLETLIGFFVLEEGAEESFGSRPASPSAPKQSAVRAISSPPKAVAKAPVSSSGSKVAGGAGSYDDGWEEF